MFTQAPSNLANTMARAQWNTLMGIATRASGATARNTARECTHSLMMTTTMGRGRGIGPRARAPP